MVDSTKVLLLCLSWASCSSRRVCAICHCLLSLVSSLSFCLNWCQYDITEVNEVLNYILLGCWRCKVDDTCGGWWRHFLKANFKTKRICDLCEIGCYFLKRHLFEHAALGTGSKCYLLFLEFCKKKKLTVVTCSYWHQHGGWLSPIKLIQSLFCIA